MAVIHRREDSAALAVAISLSHHEMPFNALISTDLLLSLVIFNGRNFSSTSPPSIPTTP